MKVVCDTNVLVSGLLFGGSSQEILRLVGRGAISNYTSPEILRELETVLLRPKFGLTGDQVTGILHELRNLFETVIPSTQILDVKTDPDDNRILEAALAARAQFIISGDKDLLDLKIWRGIGILSPADFVNTVINR